MAEETYNVTTGCNNCGTGIRLTIPKGKTIQEEKEEKICDYCDCYLSGKNCVKKEQLTCGRKSRDVFFCADCPDRRKTNG